ncbi:MAG: hypothetical protein R3E97_13535 [Candidatus Eisenbacteria bacterium]
MTLAAARRRQFRLGHALASLCAAAFVVAALMGGPTSSLAQVEETTSPEPAATGVAPATAPAAATAPSDSTSSSIIRDVHGSWARQWGGSASGLSLRLEHPAAGRSGIGRTGLRYYPSSGVRTVDGLHLSSDQAFLYGVRKFELNRGQTAFKGVGLGSSVGLFAGATASSFGWMSETDAAWLAGGAAALGAVYGAVVGYESTAWREEWRWPKTLEEDSRVQVKVRPR